MFSLIVLLLIVGAYNPNIPMHAGQPIQGQQHPGQPYPGGVPPAADYNAYNMQSEYYSNQGLIF